MQDQSYFEQRRRRRRRKGRQRACFALAIVGFVLLAAGVVHLMASP